MSKGLISIVVPVYNEEKNIVPLFERVSNVFSKIDYDFEIIYVDNCSIDNTQPEIRKLSNENKNIRGILMSRNFGSSQPSTIAGIHHAKGDAVVLIDGDIQDPPEMIPDFISKWEEGFDVVYGIRAKRKGSLIRRAGYKLFYRVFKKISYINIPLDAGDFGLVDRKVVDNIKKLKENELFFRGIRAWIGFSQTGIEYTRNERAHGKTNVSLLENFKWAKMGIFNFSYKPLEYILSISVVMTLFSFIGIVFFTIHHFVHPELPIGFSTIVILILFVSSVQLLAMGIIGEYLARIFNEVKGRPRYIIKELINNPELDSIEKINKNNSTGDDNIES